MENIQTKLIDYMNTFFPADKFVYGLLASGETFLLGGVLREYKDNDFKNSNLRDIDFVVDSKTDSLSQILKDYHPTVNRFGGYKINCNGLIIDIWSLNETWAFKNKLIKCKDTEYRERLQDTVFLNMDSIVYNLTTKKWFDQNYQLAMKTKILDTVLKDNPAIPLNILRAIIIKKKYGMLFSDRLNVICKDFINNNINYLECFMNIQKDRYDKVIIDKFEIQKELLNEKLD